MTSGPYEPVEAEVLKDLIDGKINQQDLAHRIRTSRVAVNQVLNGKRGLTPIMALKLEAALGLPARKIMERQLVRDLDKAYEENKDLLESIRNNPIEVIGETQKEGVG